METFKPDAPAFTIPGEQRAWVTSHFLGDGSWSGLDAEEEKRAEQVWEVIPSDQLSRKVPKLLREGCLVLDTDGDRVLKLTASRYQYLAPNYDAAGQATWPEIAKVSSNYSGIDYDGARHFVVLRSSIIKPVTAKELAEVAALLGIDVADMTAAKASKA